MNSNGLQKAAWLHHSNVPVEDMILCGQLLPYTETVLQAKELTQQGVLPELLHELCYANLPKFTTPQIVYIHERCEQEGIEKILELLKAGIIPERLRSALHIQREFPDKSAGEIKKAMDTSLNLEDTRARLSGREIWRTPVSSSVPKRRQRSVRIPMGKDQIKVSPMEAEMREFIQSQQRDRAPASMFLNQRHADVVRGLQRTGWSMARGRRSPHTVFQKQGHGIIVLPCQHRGLPGRINPYTVASAFAQAGVGKEEALGILNLRR